MSTLRERCEAVLKAENFSTDPWACPVCQKQASRAHFIAEHILGHLSERKPVAQEAPNRFQLLELE